MKKIHIVSYTHWDREFRWEFEHTRMKLVECIDHLLDIMLKDPRYKHFLLDGQACILDDYLEIRPERERTIRELISQGRLEVGPWYTLPDCSTVNGESVVRNLKYGIRIANTYGGAMMCGYSVFSFGQIAQLPQIYRQFGIDTIVFYKHMHPSRSSSPEFIWEAPDGSRCLASRLGPEARWNFFFAAHIPIMYGLDPWHRSWRYEYGTLGKIFHTADPEGYGWFHEIIDPETTYHPDKIEEGFKRALGTVSGTSAPQTLLFFDGTDFTEPHPLIPEVLAEFSRRFGSEYEIVHSTLSSYLDELKRALAGKDLPIVRGPMRDGPVGAVHSDVLTTHPELKLLNGSVENRLLRFAEPLASLVWALGIDCYPKTYLDKVWRLMFQSHPHDSVHGLGPSELAESCASRMRQAGRIAEGLERAALARITKEIDTSREDSTTFLAVYNTCAFERGEPVEAFVDVPAEIPLDELVIEDASGRTVALQELGRTSTRAGIYHPRSRNMPFYCTRVHVLFEASRVPGLGYTTYRVKCKAKREYPYPHEDWDPVRPIKGDLLVSPTAAQNEHLRLDVNPDGTFDITDLADGFAYRGLNYLLDSGDRGNMWMSNPPERDTLISSRGKPAEVECVYHGPLAVAFRIRTRLVVPARYDFSTGVRSSDTVELPVEAELLLRKGSRYIEVALKVCNTARDHYLKVCFPTGLSAPTTCADGSFAVTEYSTRPDLERELARHPAQLWFDLYDGERGLAVLLRSTKDYEVAWEDGRSTLQMGLLRAVRLRIPCDNRLWMEYPGDEGAQVLGTTVHRYAIMPHRERWESGVLYREALRFNQPLRPCQFGRQRGRLPLEAGFLSISDGRLVLSAVKKADDRDSVIVRLFNPTGQTIGARLDVGWPFVKAWQVRLSEERVQMLPCNGRSVELAVRGGEIFTMELEGKA